MVLTVAPPKGWAMASVTPATAAQVVAAVPSPAVGGSAAGTPGTGPSGFEYPHVTHPGRVDGVVDVGGAGVGP